MQARVARWRPRAATMIETLGQRWGGRGMRTRRRRWARRSRTADASASDSPAAAASGCPFACFGWRRHEQEARLKRIACRAPLAPRVGGTMLAGCRPREKRGR